MSAMQTPSSGPSGHLLPDGEKNKEALRPLSLSPSGRGWIGEAETGEGVCPHCIEDANP
jgi:hypothetical protein